MHVHLNVKFSSSFPAGSTSRILFSAFETVAVLCEV